MARLFLAIATAIGIAVAAAGGCSSPDSSSAAHKPAGTPTDPVLVCERLADVCRLDGSRLGVCIAAPAGQSPEACAGRPRCFICAPQH